VNKLTVWQQSACKYFSLRRNIFTCLQQHDHCVCCRQNGIGYVRNSLAVT